MRRDACRDVVENRLGVGFLFQHDDRFRHLAGFVIGTRNHRGVRDARMRQQHRFELRRRHLETLVLNQFLRAIDDEEMAVLVGITNVAGVQDFAQFLYLPRVAASEVLAQAIRTGVGLPAWEADASDRTKRPPASWWGERPFPG